MSQSNPAMNGFGLDGSLDDFAGFQRVQSVYPWWLFFVMVMDADFER